VGLIVRSLKKNIMKKLGFSIALFVFIAGTILTSYGNIPDNKLVITTLIIQDAQKEKVNSKKDLKENQNEGTSAFKNFKKESESKIKKIDDGIGDLKVKFYKSKIKDKEAYQNNLNQLEEKYDVLKKKLADYKMDSQNGWNSFKVEFDRDLEELSKALKNFSTSNKK
jgi:uncharacterized protein with gpF-like domain